VTVEIPGVAESRRRVPGTVILSRKNAEKSPPPGDRRWIRLTVFRDAAL